VDRALQPLEEPDLHHADEEVLTLGLGEVPHLSVLFLPVFRLQELRGIEQRQPVTADLIVQPVIIHEQVFCIQFRIDGDWLGPGGEASQFFQTALIVALDVAARPRDGQRVEQLEEIRTKALQERGYSAGFGLLPSPGSEMSLRLPQGFFKIGDSHRITERGVGSLVVDDVATGDDGYLISEVSQRVVDRRGRQQQHLRLDAGADDGLHQSFVPAHADKLAGLVMPAFGVIAEVMRFIDHDQVIGAPVEIGQVNSI
jgi:hypothetical protein